MSLAKNLGGSVQNFLNILLQICENPERHQKLKKVKIYFKNAILGGGRVALTKLS
jgi:predicted ATPase